jgi:hypothetical protein
VLGVSTIDVMLDNKVITIKRRFEGTSCFKTWVTAFWTINNRKFQFCSIHQISTNKISPIIMFWQFMRRSSFHSFLHWKKILQTYIYTQLLSVDSNLFVICMFKFIDFGCQNQRTTAESLQKCKWVLHIMG